MMTYKLFDRSGNLVTELPSETPRGETPDIIEYRAFMYVRFGIQETTATFKLALIQKFERNR